MPQELAHRGEALGKVMAYAYAGTVQKTPEDMVNVFNMIRDLADKGLHYHTSRL